MAVGTVEAAPMRAAAQPVAMAILLSISLGHMLNDMMQSALTSIYPLVKDSLNLDFAHIGIVTFVFQMSASILQPLVGIYTDKRPMPFSLPLGMGSTLIGMAVLAVAPSFGALLVAAVLIGIGSSIFHPEASRVARLASGGRFGFAQSVFQVGGNFGQAIGPLLVALIVIPRSQAHIAWFALAAVIGIVVLGNVGFWYRAKLAEHRAAKKTGAVVSHNVPRALVTASIVILLALTFSKNVYMASFASYYTFFLIDRFDLSVQSAQIHLFLFLGATAAGTFFGGPIGDRIGRKPVMWLSILGVLPLTVALPYVNLFWTDVMAIGAGFLMASAFPAILVYAQDLLPGRVGMVAGLFFGFAFGMGGIGAAALGWLADLTSIAFVFQICAWLPALGALVWFLPNLDRHKLQPA